MDLNEYSVGDTVELTKSVCENKKGEQGVIYKGQRGNYILFPDGTALITGHIKMIASNQDKIERDLLLTGNAFTIEGVHFPVESVRMYTRTKE